MDVQLFIIHHRVMFNLQDLVQMYNSLIFHCNIASSFVVASLLVQARYYVNT